MVKNTYIIITGIILLSLFTQCAVTSGGKNRAAENLTVEGIVLTPTEEPVINAEVRSMPSSEIVITDNQGRFMITRGLKPGKYEFIAETSEGNTGTTLASLAYTETGNMRIKIVLGMKLDMKTLTENKLRDVFKKSKGEKRVGEK